MLCRKRRYKSCANPSSCETQGLLKDYRADKVQARAVKSRILKYTSLFFRKVGDAVHTLDKTLLVCLPVKYWVSQSYSAITHVNLFAHMSVSHAPGFAPTHNCAHVPTLSASPAPALHIAFDICCLK